MFADSPIGNVDDSLAIVESIKSNTSIGASEMESWTIGHCQPDITASLREDVRRSIEEEMHRSHIIDDVHHSNSSQHFDDDRRYTHPDDSFSIPQAISAALRSEIRRTMTDEIRKSMTSFDELTHSPTQSFDEESNARTSSANSGRLSSSSNKRPAKLADAILTDVQLHRSGSGSGSIDRQNGHPDETNGNRDSNMGGVLSALALSTLTDCSYMFNISDDKEHEKKQKPMARSQSHNEPRPKSNPSNPIRKIQSSPVCSMSNLGGEPEEEQEKPPAKEAHMRKPSPQYYESTHAHHDHHKKEPGKGGIVSIVSKSLSRILAKSSKDPRMSKPIPRPQLMRNVEVLHTYLKDNSDSEGDKEIIIQVDEKDITDSLQKRTHSLITEVSEEIEASETMLQMSQQPDTPFDRPSTQSPSPGDRPPSRYDTPDSMQPSSPVPSIKVEDFDYPPKYLWEFPDSASSSMSESMFIDGAKERGEWKQQEHDGEETPAITISREEVIYSIFEWLTTIEKLCMVGGPALRGGVVGREGVFYLELDKESIDLDKVEIEILGPNSTRPWLGVVQLDETLYEARYIPDMAGEYQVSVSYDDLHLLGSPFIFQVISEEQHQRNLDQQEQELLQKQQQQQQDKQDKQKQRHQERDQRREQLISASQKRLKVLRDQYQKNEQLETEQKSLQQEGLHQVIDETNPHESHERHQRVSNNLQDIESIISDHRTRKHDIPSSKPQSSTVHSPPQSSTDTYHQQPRTIAYAQPRTAADDTIIAVAQPQDYLLQSTATTAYHQTGSSTQKRVQFRAELHQPFQLQPALPYQSSQDEKETEEDEFDEGLDEVDAMADEVGEEESEVNMTKKRRKHKQTLEESRL